MAERRDAMSERPVVTVRHPRRLFGALEGVFKLACEDMCQRPVRVERPTLRIMRTELDGLREVWDRLGKATLVRQRVTQAAVNNREVGIERHRGLEFRHRIPIRLARQ